MRWAVVVAVVSLFTAELFADSGRIVLELTNGDKVTGATAVNRVENTRTPGKLVKGKFLFSDLKPGIYDIVLDTEIGTIEGVNLKTYDELGELEDPEKIGTMRAKDFKEIYNKAKNMKIFENKRRIFELRGHRKRVRVLVEKLMDEQTSLDAQKGSKVITWRIEIWTYRYWTGGWLRDQTFELIQRRLLDPAKLARLRWNYEPELGGILVTDAEPARVKYTVPEKLDPRRGIVDGRREEPQIKGPPDEKDDGEETEEVKEIE